MTGLPDPHPSSPLIPHPFLASTSGTKKGKKQHYDKKQQLPLQTQAGGWVFLPSVLLVYTFNPASSLALYQMEGIFLEIYILEICSLFII